MAFAFKELIKSPTMENTFRYLGENKNSATIIACSIAVFKGIFRPLFTMMDKKSDPETKKYAAIREGLTEVAAFPLYAFTPWLAEKVVKKFLPAPDIAKTAESKVFAQAKMVGNAKFLGICAATLIIPAVCNMIQPPIMAAYKRSQDAKKAKLDINSSSEISPPMIVNKPEVPVSSALAKSSSVSSSGMRVGN